ncbi:MAG: NBR1-Ig-like domain-containing protein [Chloroflexota bacterium]
MMLQKILKITVLLSLSLLVSCQMFAPGAQAVSTLDATSIYATSVARVTAAHLQTEAVQAMAASEISLAGTAAYAVNPIPTLDRTRPLNATPTKVPDCNIAAPGTPFDITIWDDTVLNPGESFTKTWRLLNSGSCTWTRLYALVFFSGNPLDAMQTYYLLGEVPPGSMVDLSVDMVAPMRSGSYQSNWMLQNEAGEFFGIGPNGDAPIWARIQVVQVFTDTPVPTFTQTPTPVIYLSDLVALVNNDQLDLDTNEINPGSGLADIVYTRMGTNSHILTPNNGAGIKLFGAKQPGFSDCKNAVIGSTPISFNSILPDTYVCYHTNQGLPGRLHLISYDEATGIVEIEFLTWSLP